MASVFADTRTVSVNGTELAYRERGEGEPVVFVHGAVSDLRTWDAQVDALANDRRAIAYSARYARPNEDIAPGVDNPMTEHVEDLAALVEALDAAPAHLVGNSSGAFVGLLTASRHPEAVRSLALEEPPAMTLFTSLPPRPPELARLLATRPRTAAAIIRMGATALGPAEKAFRRGDDEEGMRRFLSGVIGADRWDRLSDERREQARQNVAALRAMLVGEDGLAAIDDDEVRGVTTRTLLLVGEDSPAFSHRLTDRLEDLLPDATRVAIPDASHLTHEDNPAAVDDALRAFLEAG